MKFLKENDFKFRKLSQFIFLKKPLRLLNNLKNSKAGRVVQW